MQQVDPACSMQNLGATCPTDAVAAGTVLMLVNAKLSAINADLATVLSQVPDITMEMIACAVGQDPSCDQGATAISIRDTIVQMATGCAANRMINPCTVPAIQGLLAEVPAIMQQVDPACSMQNLGATCPTDAVAAGTVLMLVNAKLSAINADLATVLTQVPDITMEMVACAVGQDPSCDQGATAISIRDTIVQMATGCAAN